MSYLLSLVTLPLFYKDIYIYDSLIYYTIALGANLAFILSYHKKQTKYINSKGIKHKKVNVRLTPYEFKRIKSNVPKIPDKPVPEDQAPTNVEGKDFKNPKITPSPSAYILPHITDPTKDR